ncbi:MAG: prepilin peptidase [Bdellovibrionaceae bacterium]|nr:prepilin peptidase [Pseudobdellovibrionaceae bacterium]
MMNLNAAFLIPTSLLMVAATFDIRFGKFPNWLFIISFFAGVLWLALSGDIKMFLVSFGYSILFFIALTPLVYFKAFGAGDIKLLLSLSLFTGVITAATVLVYALFWGLLMGLIKIMLSGQFTTFIQSFLLRNPQVKNQRIPFVVAILLGWFSFFVAGDLL